jgi:hypothetical protein
MSTVASLIDAAFNRSLKARPAQFNEPVELLSIVKRSVLECFIAAAAVDPKFFGKQAAVAFASGGWAIPADSLSVFRIENGSASRVVEVPLHDRGADVAQPAVYRLGGSFYGAGNAGDPTSGNLTLFYARTPVQPAATSDSTDPALAADWDEIHVLALYIHMVEKDAANHPPGEAERQTATRAKWLDDFRAAVGLTSTSAVNRMGSGT